MEIWEKINYMYDLRHLNPQVHHPVDYARVVSRIANEMDLTLVDLDDILPAATVMVVTVSIGGDGDSRRSTE